MEVLVTEENYEARTIQYREDLGIMLIMSKYQAKGATVD